MLEKISAYLQSLIGVSLDFEDIYVRVQSGTSSYSYQWNYGAMIEYICSFLLLLLLFKMAFKFLDKCFHF